MGKKVVKKRIKVTKIKKWNKKELINFLVKNNCIEINVVILNDEVYGQIIVVKNNKTWKEKNATNQ